MSSSKSSGRRQRVELSLLTAEGIIQDLTYGGLAWWGTERDGLGMSPLHRISERGPDQHGVSDLGFRLDERMANLILTVTGYNDTIVEAKLERLALLLKPRDVPYSLRFRKVTSGQVRQLDCFTVKGPDFSFAEQMETAGGRGLAYRAGLTLYAPNPVFYDPSSLQQSFGLTGGGGAWAIPWTIPWGIGASVLNQSVTINYVGNWLEYPIITVVGPITDCLITNGASGDIISFVGQIINTGTTLTIDLRPGHKTVVDQTGANKISLLATNSDLTTFSLLPDPDVVGGANTLTVTGTGVSTVTQVYVSWYSRYVSL